MGVKCGRQMNCCLEVDLSHKSNNNIQDPYNQNTQRFLNDKNIITKKKIQFIMLMHLQKNL